jgi:DNA polymerase alpha subunit B
LVINPGLLSRRSGTGLETYARMILHAPKLTEEEMAGDAMVLHRVFKRARVEITRI